MKTSRILLAAWVIFVAFGALAPAQDVKTDYDHHADFGRYHS